MSETDVRPETQLDGPSIQITGLNKWFGAFHVLRDIDLEVAQGERIVVCGPSGSGKSTLIRCINRLEEHQEGKIIVDGVHLTNDLKQIDAVRSEVGMVFQSFNLFPHLTVLENCTLAPIWVRNQPKAEAEAAAMEYLERVKIPEQANKFPGHVRYIMSKLSSPPRGISLVINSYRCLGLFGISLNLDIGSNPALTILISNFFVTCFNSNK